MVSKWKWKTAAIVGLIWGIAAAATSAIREGGQASGGAAQAIYTVALCIVAAIAIAAIRNRVVGAR